MSASDTMVSTWKSNRQPVWKKKHLRNNAKALLEDCHSSSSCSSSSSSSSSSRSSSSSSSNISRTSNNSSKEVILVLVRLRVRKRRFPSRYGSRPGFAEQERAERLVIEVVI